MSVVGWQRIEGAVAAIAAIGLVVCLPGSVPVWAWPVFLLLPDLFMLGYLAGPARGAAIYNAAHLYGTGLAVALIALLARSDLMAAAGLLWVAHVGIDRALGYGLKLPTGFQDTHLGRIGRG